MVEQFAFVFVTIRDSLLLKAPVGKLVFHVTNSNAKYLFKTRRI